MFAYLELEFNGGPAFYLLTLSGPHICPSMSIAVGGSTRGEMDGPSGGRGLWACGRKQAFLSRALVDSGHLRAKQGSDVL